jgi:hypothetical protein
VQRKDTPYNSITSFESVKGHFEVWLLKLFIPPGRQIPNPFFGLNIFSDWREDAGIGK